MLGLRQQVHGDVGRVLRAVGHDDDFGRAGDAVDADTTKHLALGFGDIGVAGSDDAVDRRDRGGAVGEGGDGLGAADAIDLRHAGALGGGQDQRLEMTAGAGDGHGDAGHAGDAGGEGVHQNGGRVGRLAAGDVEADGVERGPAHAEVEAGLVGPFEVGGHLQAVECLDPLGGQVERLEQRRGDRGGCGVDLFGRDAMVSWA